MTFKYAKSVTISVFEVFALNISLGVGGDILSEIPHAVVDDKRYAISL